MLGVVVKNWFGARLRDLARGPCWPALMATVIVAVTSATPVRALSIEITGGGADRLDRQRAWAEGELPLAGTPDLGSCPNACPPPD